MPLVLLVTLAGVFVIPVWRLSGQGSSNTAVASVPVVGTVGARSDDGSQAVQLVYTLSQSSLVSASRFGTVTAVNLEAGDEVTNGMVVGSVDEVPLVAFVAELPLYRVLEIGVDGGRDIAALANFLRQTGFLHETVDGGDEFTEEIELAVIAWQTATGFEPTGAISPTDFVFVSADATSVATVLFRVGQSMASQQGVYESVQSILSAEVVLVAPPSRRRVLDGATGFSLGDGFSNVSISSLQPAANELASIQSLIVDPRRGLRLDGSVVEGLILSREDRLTFGVVPPLAVLNTSDGRSCLLVALDNSTRPTVHFLNDITMPGFDDASILVSEDLIGSSIIVNAALTEYGRSPCD